MNRKARSAASGVSASLLRQVWNAHMLNLLVPIADRDQNWRALHAALALAKRLNGHVDAVFVTAETRANLSLPSEGAPESFLREAIARAERESAERAAEAEQRFADVLRRHNLAVVDQPTDPGEPSATWTVTEGTLPDVVQRWGGTHDATVLARGGGADGAWRNSVETALFATGQPVLLVPFEDRSPIGEKVVVGWNRTAQSARAMRDALPLLRQAKSVTIFSVATGAKEGPSAHEAGRYLQWHGIANEVIEVPPSRENVGKALIAKAHEVGADLLVLGAYSHSRFREAILGGVTRHVVAQADLPVLMSH
jgi:nucleotide-binding universal stress UspA family protein